jgi:hypothetical protein
LSQWNANTSTKGTGLGCGVLVVEVLAGGGIVTHVTFVTYSVVASGVDTDSYDGQDGALVGGLESTVGLDGATVQSCV